jgi:hypothetical protein
MRTTGLVDTAGLFLVGFGVLAAACFWPTCVLAGQHT